MRFFALLVFLLFIVYALVARWYFVCEIRQLCIEEPEDIRMQTLSLTEGDSAVIYDGFDQFAFDSINVEPRLNENNKQFLDTVAHYLKNNPAKNLEITAFYRPMAAGVQHDIFENLGTARGDAIRQLLLSRGINEDRFSLDYGVSEDPQLREPLLFDAYIPSDAPSEFDKVQYSFTNMTFSDANFAFDSDEFRPGTPFVLYADSVKTYLELNPEKKLTIIGHTDEVGEDAYNYGLGLRRAKSAREYFSELGVTSEIITESMGEERPAAPNDTEEGRQKNRRVNFVLE